MFEIVLLIIGIAGLVLGTELTIRGAMNIANHYNFSHVFIGVTILALGTDLSELVLAITGAIKKLEGVDTSGLIIGNALGSNFGQIGLTLGVVGLVCFFILRRKEIIIDGSMLIGSLILLFVIGFDGKITQLEGGILIIAYLIYYYSLFRVEKVKRKMKKDPSMHLLWDIVYLLSGLFIVVYSSNVAIDNALLITERFGVDQTIIGILVIGLGTSLPELTVSIGAVIKKAKGLSIGNLIGSNIFDTLVPIGVAGAIAGLNMPKSLLYFDIPFLFILSILVLLFFMRKKGLQKKEAVVILVAYFLYAALKIYGY